MSLSYSQSISIKKIKFVSVMNKIKIKYLNNKDEDFNICIFWNNMSECKSIDEFEKLLCSCTNQI